MKSTKKPLAAAIGGAIVSTAILAAPVQAAGSNPFSVTELSQGYTLAMGDKPAEGKCGEGKKKKEGKCGEGKCGSKKKEGKCGSKKKEGKCGEGKCGGSKY